jgi:taurine dioxygenase
MVEATAQSSSATRTAPPALEIRKLAPGIGAEIVGLDVSQPMSDAVFAAVEQAWHDHLVLLFREQDLSEEQEVAFGARFGPLAQRINKVPTVAIKHPSVMLISNVRENGELIGALPDGEMFFHSDQCYIERPSMAAVLYAIEIPSQGGNTIFANTYLAYETLPADLKAAIAGKMALNVYDYENAGTTGGEVRDTAPRHAHPIVRTHPATKRKALYVNRLMTREIVGMPRAESDALLQRLFDHQEQKQFLYEHVWRPGDLLIWDNRCTLHARTDFDSSERRLLRRVAILGEKPV